MAKVLVSMSDELLRRVDERARELGLTRSAYLAQVASADLPARRPSAESIARIQRARDLVRRELRSRTTAGGHQDSTDLVRQMRDER